MESGKWKGEGGAFGAGEKAEGRRKKVEGLKKETGDRRQNSGENFAFGFSL